MSKKLNKIQETEITENATLTIESTENKVTMQYIIDQLDKGMTIKECGIEFVKYISTSTKKAIIDQIVINSLEEDNGMIYENPLSRQLAISLSMIQFYTNIEDYDFDVLCEKGIMDDIEKELYNNGSDFLLLRDLVYETIEVEKEKKNSLVGMLNRNINKLISSLPTEKEMSKLLKNLPKTLEKISPDTLNLLKDISVGKIK